ncbi:hypothetical protein D0817_05005 [Flavobacterium cupreum]|uniref:Uncharacterized protein n=1 Tax=Flavobacterium cupreum TaxID=2133766 RepID=A0A434AA26_9FLAO|nr:hypothetical protein D0817_05005 [Flavobacterium cupreum]
MLFHLFISQYKTETRLVKIKNKFAALSVLKLLFQSRENRLIETVSLRKPKTNSKDFYKKMRNGVYISLRIIKKISF